MFADVAKIHAQYVAQHVLGERVEYMHHPSVIFSEIAAVVDRNPAEVGFGGQHPENHIEIHVSRTAMPNPQIGKDKIRLASLKAGEAGRVYRVTQLLGESPGAWRLECVE